MKKQKSKGKGKHHSKRKKDGNHKNNNKNQQQGKKTLSWVDEYLNWIPVDDITVVEEENVDEHDTNDDDENEHENENEHGDNKEDSDDDDDDDDDDDQDDDDDNKEENDNDQEDETTTTTTRKKETRIDNDSSSSSLFSIISWNVLAESYCSYRSQQHLPMKYQHHVFDRHQRSHHIRQILRTIFLGPTSTCNVDFVALQEVDGPLNITTTEFLQSINNNNNNNNGDEYQYIQTPTCPAGNNGRVDSCVLFYKHNIWECIDSQILRLDDLSTLCTKNNNSSSSNTTTTTNPEKVENNDDEDTNNGNQDATATSSSSSSSSDTNHKGKNKHKNKNKSRNNNNKINIMATTTNLQGIQSSFVRKNMALLVKMKHKNKPNQPPIVIAVMHLYWNPSYDYVKLCQAHYVAKCAKEFSQRPIPSNNNYYSSQQHQQQQQDQQQIHNDIPIILCGDLNSQPNGPVHEYLVKGWINAKKVAPWYAHYYSQQNENDKPNDTATDIDNITSSISQVTLSNNSEDDNNNNNNKNIASNSITTKANTNGTTTTTNNNNNDKTKENSINDNVPKVRYMLDFTLNRFSRWLRILGLDAALETEEEERLRTKEGNITMFEQCKQEQRILVTTSSRILLRKDCPPGAYLLDTKSLSNLELTLVHMLLSHGVVLNPSTFLSRCVVCNGHIEQVFDETTIQKIFASHQAPLESIMNNNNNNDNNNSNNSEDQNVMEVYQCINCQQGYWWCELPTSSASRVKSQATKLLELCIRGGVPVTEDSMGIFDYINLDQLQNDEDDDAPEKQLIHQRLDVLEWLQCERLENPCRPMKNVYAKIISTTKDNDDHDDDDVVVDRMIDNIHETLPFTNVTYDFVGHLDYILHPINDPRLKVEQVLYVPKSFPILNRERIRNGHLLPSNVWPSDHLAVGAKFSFVPSEENNNNNNNHDDVKNNSEKNTPSTEINSLKTESNNSAQAPATTTSTATTTENSSNTAAAAQGTTTAYDAAIPFCMPVPSEDSTKSSTIVPVPSGAIPSQVISSMHGQRCACGCVPNILSLFEMAELRKKARLKKQQEEQQQQLQQLQQQYNDDDEEEEEE